MQCHRVGGFVVICLIQLPKIVHIWQRVRMNKMVSTGSEDRRWSVSVVLPKENVVSYLSKDSFPLTLDSAGGLKYVKR